MILNTGSIAGLVGWGGTVYGATKGGVHQLTKAVAIEIWPAVEPLARLVLATCTLPLARSAWLFASSVVAASGT